MPSHIYNIFNRLPHLHMSLIAAAILSASTCLQAEAGILGVYGEDHSSIGIYIKDLKADTVILASDAKRALAPASTNKALTSASALTLLGPDYRFRTSVAVSGDIDSDGVLHGCLIVTASGDPTLESENFKSYCGFTDSICAAVSRLGIKRIDGTVEITEYMPEPGPVVQWEIDDVAWAYGAGLFHFNYRDNIFRLWPATGDTRPEVPELNVSLEPHGDGVDLIRGIYSDNLVVTGRGALNKKYSVSTTMPDPGAVFIYELTEKLIKHGINVSDNDYEFGKQSCRIIYTHNSPALADILRSLMVRSDNMFAEGVLRAFAPGRERADAINAELKLWKERGLETDFVTIKDGSGLARANRFSPKFIGDMLEWMSRSGMADRYVSLFPLSGKDGTMRNFMADTRLKGRLALKTGSMSGVQCYAGYKIDENGKPTHIVVFMANSFFCSRADLRTALRKLLLEKLK